MAPLTEQTPRRTVEIGRAFWGVVLVATLVLAFLVWRVHIADQTQSRKLAQVECLDTQGILRRQLAGSKTSRGTDRFFATQSLSPIFRSHFGTLVPIQTARIAAITRSLKALGKCK